MVWNYPLLVKIVDQHDKSLYFYIEDKYKNMSVNNCKEVYVQENLILTKSKIDLFLWQSIYRIHTIKEYSSIYVNFRDSTILYPLYMVLDTLLLNKDKEIYIFNIPESFEFKIDLPENNYCFSL